MFKSPNNDYTVLYAFGVLYKTGNTDCQYKKFPMFGQYFSNFLRFNELRPFVHSGHKAVLYRQTIKVDKFFYLYNPRRFKKPRKAGNPRTNLLEVWLGDDRSIKGKYTVILRRSKDAGRLVRGAKRVAGCVIVLLAIDGGVVRISETGQLKVKE